MRNKKVPSSITYALITLGTETIKNKYVFNTVITHTLTWWLI